MGAKTRLTAEILAAIERAAPDGGAALDLMSGTAVVSAALARDGRRVVANDVQGYAATIAASYLLPGLPTRLDLEADLGRVYRENVAALLERLAPAVAVEDAFLEAFDLAPEAKDTHGPDGVLALDVDPALVAAARRSLAREAPRDRAAAYRTFALRGTPAFLETRDAPVSGAFSRARDLFTREAVLARRADPGLRPYLLASSYYPNVYLGLRQAIAVDGLRAAIDAVEDPRRRTHWLAALLHATSVATSATSHFCQPRGLVRDAEVRAVLARRALSIPSKTAAFSASIAATVRGARLHPKNAALEGDWRAALARWDGGPGDVVYADPPYTADHYSRFYHALEVLCRYDYPPLATTRGAPTKGRYPARTSRARSAFCVRSAVEGEFRALVHGVADRGAALVLSYGEENGLLLRTWRDAGASAQDAMRRLAALCGEAFHDVDVERRALLHSGQGDSNHTITELLVIARRPRAARARRRAAGSAACA